MVESLSLQGDKAGLISVPVPTSHVTLSDLTLWAYFLIWKLRIKPPASLIRPLLHEFNDITPKCLVHSRGSEVAGPPSARLYTWPGCVPL